MKTTVDGGIPVDYITLPRRANPCWPNTSHLTIRCGDVDRLCVGLTGKREVWVGIDGESIGIGEQTDPGGVGAGTIAHHDEWTLTFTNTRDRADGLVDFQVASDCEFN